MAKRKKQTRTSLIEFGECVDSPEMNEAMIKHVSGETPSTIKEFGCNKNGKNCIYMDDCQIKNYYDGVIWNGLKANTVISIEIRFCNHFETPETGIKKIKNLELMDII